MPRKKKEVPPGITITVRVQFGDDVSPEIRRGYIWCAFEGEALLRNQPEGWRERFDEAMKLADSIPRGEKTFDDYARIYAALKGIDFQSAVKEMMG